jgi:hypothetical protein
VAHRRDRRCKGALADPGPADIAGAIDRRLARGSFSWRDGSGAAVDDEGRLGGGAAQ